MTDPNKCSNILCFTENLQLQKRIKELEEQQMDWKEYSASVKIPAGSTIGKLIQKRINEAVECTIHNINYEIFSNPYRRYRRGKNRCKRCGLKI